MQVRWAICLQWDRMTKTPIALVHTYGPRFRIGGFSGKRHDMETMKERKVGGVGWGGGGFKTHIQDSSFPLTFLPHFQEKKLTPVPNPFSLTTGSS